MYNRQKHVKNMSKTSAMFIACHILKQNPRKSTDHCKLTTDPGFMLPSKLFTPKTITVNMVPIFKQPNRKYHRHGIAITDKGRAPYLLDGVEVDVYDSVEILSDDLGDLFELLKVERLVGFDVHVDCDGGQVAHRHLEGERKRMNAA